MIPLQLLEVDIDKDAMYAGAIWAVPNTKTVFLVVMVLSDTEVIVRKAVGF
ncbi:MAG: hypothetical protein ACPGF8_05415 [Opitutales bacterium]